MQPVKWVVTKLQGDKTASFYREMSGREVTGRQISIPVFHGTLLPMDFWTPPHFLRLGKASSDSLLLKDFLGPQCVLNQ